MQLEEEEGKKGKGRERKEAGVIYYVYLGRRKLEGEKGEKEKVIERWYETCLPR